MSESQQNEVQRARDEAERRKRSTQSASAARIAYQHQWVDEQIRIAVHDCIRKAGGKGHILNLGHGVLQGTPERAVQAFVDAAKEVEL